MADLLDPETARKQSLELGADVDIHDPYPGAFGALMQRYQQAWETIKVQRDTIASYKQQVKELSNG